MQLRTAGIAHRSILGRARAENETVPNLELPERLAAELGDRQDEYAVAQGKAS
jgi:hypothetical protein